MGKPNASKRRRAAFKRKRKERKARDEQMTSEHGRRDHRACGRKSRFPDEASAIASASYLMHKGNKSLRVYHCPYCGGWHLTSH